MTHVSAFFIVPATALDALPAGLWIAQDAASLPRMEVGSFRLGGKMQEGSKLEGVVVISTWRFGKAANEAAVEMLAEGGYALDAVEQGIHVIEADPEIGSVGYGGAPNAEGVVQVDAAIMWGPGHRAGSVAGLEGILHPISVARKVMEDTPHVMLVGEGALKFALSCGFKPQDLTTEESRRKWRAWQEAPQPPKDTHDTIGMVVLDGRGDIAAGCSTSGWAYKLPGRVGDSPIIGSGLYVDNRIGGAAATGTGEEIMKYCISFSAVEHMRRGMSPGEACVEAVRRMVETDLENRNTGVGVVALNKHGEYGAAGMKKGFPYAVFANGEHAFEEGGYVVD